MVATMCWHAISRPQAGGSFVLGEKTCPASLGAKGTTEELMASGVMHDRKVALTRRTYALAQEGKLKESVDALIGTLILTLDDYALQWQKAAK